MALTNMIREPRRELTESGMGILITLVVIGVAYLPGSYLASKFQQMTGAPPDLWWIWALIGTVICFFGGWLILSITHNVGERFCNNLAQSGLELRPERFPRRR